jgi:hypothetical protein
MSTKLIDPEKIQIGDVVLVATRNRITEWVQGKLEFGEAT